MKPATANLICTALLLSILSIGSAEDAFGQLSKPAADGQRPAAQATSALPGGPSPPSAFALQQRTQKKPLSPRLKIIILASFFLVSVASLTIAMRAWRSWNLFDRQYRFPPVARPALRFGANKSGGCMATIVFGEGADSTPEDF